MRQHRLLGPLIIAACALAPMAVAADGCATSKSRLPTHPALNVRIDNDLFGGLAQDQGYSNGFLVSVVSPNLVDYVDDPCLPRLARRLNRYLSWLNPAGFDEQNMTAGFGQLLYTPADETRSDLIEDDRPYAGALMFSLGYHLGKRSSDDERSP